MAVQKVSINYTFATLNCTKLTSEVRSTLTAAVIDGVLSGLPQGYNSKHIDVNLRCGSIVAEAVITPMENTTPTQLGGLLGGSGKTTKLNDAVLTKVKNSPGISTVLAAGKQMVDMDVAASAPKLRAFMVAATTSTAPASTTLNGMEEITSSITSTARASTTLHGEAEVVTSSAFTATLQGAFMTIALIRLVF